MPTLHSNYVKQNCQSINFNFQAGKTVLCSKFANRFDRFTFFKGVLSETLMSLVDHVTTYYQKWDYIKIYVKERQFVNVYAWKNEEAETPQFLSNYAPTLNDSYRNCTQTSSDQLATPYSNNVNLNFSIKIVKNESLA